MPAEDCEWERRDGDGVTGFGDPELLPIPIVEIFEWDTVFTSKGCGTWSNDRTPIVLPGETFGDGAWFVGAEIAPGRYRAPQASDTCRWWRLDGLSDTYGMDLTSFGGNRPNVAGRAYPGFTNTIVEIAGSDVAFVSRDCGVWTSDLTPTVAPGEPFGDGTFLVGSEIAPGRYYATIPDSCSWSRLGDFSGRHNYGYGAIHRGSAAYRIVDIAKDDVGFSSRGCGTWAAELVPVVTPGQSFGAGGFVVGPEIAPGRYRASSPEACFWWRLGGFTGSVDLSRPDVVGFGHGGHPVTIVDIKPSDAGFWSRDCGTWTTDLTPIVMPGQPFGDGTFLVGPEVAPGRYRTTAPPPSGCEWLTLREGGFSGANERGDHAGAFGGSEGVVEITREDIAFATRGCGTWTPAPP